MSSASNTPSPALPRPAAVVGSRHIGLVLGAALAWGCSARADIPEVVVEQTDVSFEGVPELPGLGSVTSTVSTSFNHPRGYKLPDLFESELYPRSATITGRGDMQDLSFIEGVTLKLASRAEGAPPPIVVASYERDAMPAGRAIDLETSTETDVLEYWTTKSAYYEVELWGTLPEADWAVDITASFAGEIAVFAGN